MTEQVRRLVDELREMAATYQREVSANLWYRDPELDSWRTRNIYIAPDGTARRELFMRRWHVVQEEPGTDIRPVVTDEELSGPDWALEKGASENEILLNP